MIYTDLILPGAFLLTALIFVILGYWMGRRTLTDTAMIRASFNPKDGKEPEQDEITRCLNGDI